MLAAIELLEKKIKISVKAAEIIFADNKIYLADKPEIYLDFAELANYTYLQRLNLGAQGYYKTPEVFFDRETMTGSPFYYFVYGVAATIVEVDILTGANKLVEVHIVHDVANPINKEVDLGQITGAFFQGFGYCTMEEMNYDGAGKYMATTLSTYKIPTICNLPEIFDIKLIERQREHASVMGSKAIGEPPLIYGFSAYFAIKHALASLNPQKAVDLPMPATTEAIVMTVKQMLEQ